MAKAPATRLQTVDVGRQAVDAYRRVVPARVLDALRDVAASLRGVRVLHLSATPYGGGVSELLRSAVPLLENLGLVPEWRVISGDESFFRVTKKIHNALQGANERLDDTDWSAYRDTCAHNAELLGGDYDVVVVHDPQPAAILTLRGRGRARWIWRCHIDTSSPNSDVWRAFRGYLEPYDAAVFTMREFVPSELPVPRVELIAPAIDPLSPKNLRIPDSTAREVLDWIGVDPDLPLVTQISRFDPWKDPLGVVAAYRRARATMPGLQLALVGSMALDDPEGWDVYRQVIDATAGDQLVHVFTNLTGVGNVEVNAFQRLSRVVLQKSIREGFGLVVSEALWKGTPVVAGRAGGIPLQLADGAGGLLVDSVEEAAEALVTLLRHPDRARELGLAGQGRVRDYFLLPRLLLDEVTLIAELLERRPTGVSYPRDPVCGLPVLAPRAVQLRRDRETLRFCSNDCRARFESGRLNAEAPIAAATHRRR
jgi:trehalose synthase